MVAIICVVAGFFARKYVGEAKIHSAEKAAENILQDAQRQAESTQREARVELKDEMHQLRTQAEAEIKERRQELTQLENRLSEPRRRSGRHAEGRGPAGAVGDRP